MIRQATEYRIGQLGTQMLVLAPNFNRSLELFTDSFLIFGAASSYRGYMTLSLIQISFMQSLDRLPAIVNELFLGPYLRT